MRDQYSLRVSTALYRLKQDIENEFALGTAPDIQKPEYPLFKDGL